METVWKDDYKEGHEALEREREISIKLLKDALR